MLCMKQKPSTTEAAQVKKGCKKSNIQTRFAAADDLVSVEDPR
jgi:hypothetical protein